MSYQEALKRIRDAKESGADKLGLSSLGLTKLPPKLVELTHLTALYLYFNQLTTLPEFLGNLTGLTRLYLSSNQLKTLPDSLGNLTNLTTLSVRGNQLKTMPDSLGNLTNLTKLNLGDNRLKTLPDSLGNLTNLTALSVRGNQVKTLPDSLGNLTNLTELNLGCNQVKTLPDSLRNLTNLTTLDLSSNQLTTLPEFVIRLPKLESLFLYGNPFEWIPQEYLGPSQYTAMDIDKLRNYFDQIAREGEDLLFEAKLLIVGEPGAGKTSLARKIEDPNYKLKKEVKESTRGIVVKPWMFKTENGRPFRLNIWDFGGQEIYKATHQFFLTKSSLYTIVADSRRDDTDFYYWMNVVDLLSDHSPILVVKNEFGDRKREIPESQLRERFSNFKDTYATNFDTNRDLPKLLDAIRYQAINLPHVGKRLPKTWVKVREALDKDPRNHVSCESFFEICRTNGITKQEDIDNLSGYLHDIGVCLHFQSDDLLKKTVFLKPNWATTAVYRLLDHPQVIANNGKFARRDLKTIWHEPEYENMQDELLRLMLNFKLCYQIPNTNEFICPQLLTENKPLYSWDDSDSRELRHEYGFMPTGIVLQLIVAMHESIEGQRLVWRSGAVLSKDDTRAEVIEFPGTQKNSPMIRVRVSGKHKRDLMTIVVHEISKIHGTFHGLQFKTMIPCNCEKCKQSDALYFFEYEELRRFEGDRQDSIQCRKSYQSVPVRGLIDEAIDRSKLAWDEREKYGDIHIHGDIADLTIAQGKTEISKSVIHRSKEKHVRSAWANGSFYLFVFLAVAAALGILANTVSPYVLPMVILAGIILVPVIGALQLKQDRNLSEKGFIELMRIAFGQLPLIGRLARSGKAD